MGSEMCIRDSSSCKRGLARTRLWRGTHLMVPHAYRITHIAFPFVLEPLSKAPARPQGPSPRTADSSRARPSLASGGNTLIPSAHVAWRGCGFGMARSWASPVTSVPVASRAPS